MKILIAGATGYIGRLLLEELRTQSYEIRCLARTPEKLDDIDDDHVEVVQGDVLKPETLRPAMKEVDCAYYLIHSMGSDGDFKKRDQRAARNFANTAEQEDVNRIIYLGGLVRDTRELSEHLKSRKEVGEILASTTVPVTEFRAAVIIGNGSASFQIMRDLVDKLPVMITPSWVNSECEPIAVEDVIHYLQASLKHPDTTGDIFEIGCGKIMTYGKMMQIVGEEMNRKFLMIPVPVLTPRLSSYWLNLMTSVPMSIAYPLVEGLRNDTYCTDRRINDILSHEPIPFREAVRQTLADEPHGAASRWYYPSPPEIRVLTPNDYPDALRDRRSLPTTAGPEALFDVISRMGGETGYYYGDWLWEIRGFFDRLIGGPGLQRGRRDPEEIRAGDGIDFWEVEAVEENKYIRLRAQMKVPGVAWLEFDITPNQDGTVELQQIATFAVNSIWGYLYWLVLLPMHLLVFKNMARQIIERAEEQEAAS